MKAFLALSALLLIAQCAVAQDAAVPQLDLNLGSTFMNQALSTAASPLPALRLPSNSDSQAKALPQADLIAPINMSDAESVKKGATVLAGAVIGSMALAGALHKAQADSSNPPSSNPSVVDYMTGKKVDDPATYVSQTPMSCTGQAYCFRQVLDKVSTPPTCPTGFALDTQTSKCFKYTGFECPMGMLPLKGNPALCQLCESKKCLKPKVLSAKPTMVYTDAKCANGFSPSAGGKCDLSCPLSSIENAAKQCEQSCPQGYSECNVLGLGKSICVTSSPVFGLDACKAAQKLYLELDKSNTCIVLGPVKVPAPKATQKSAPAPVRNPSPAAKGSTTPKSG